jgi:hypothetical protein
VLGRSTDRQRHTNVERWDEDWTLELDVGDHAKALSIIFLSINGWPLLRFHRSGTAPLSTQGYLSTWIF